MGWNGSTEKSVNQDHLVSDDSALSFSNISGRTTYAFFLQNEKKIEMYTHGVQQNIKSNFKRIRSYMYLVQPIR